MTAALVFIPTVAPTSSLSSQTKATLLQHAKTFSFSSITTTYIHQTRKHLPSVLRTETRGNKGNACLVLACLPSSSAPKTRVYVSGLSFRTTEESLQNAFQNFGKLVEVNLVMDKIANRPRGFAFLRYATEEESQNAIEGMHGKFLDGRVIFVEVAKPRSELRKGIQNNQRRF